MDQLEIHWDWANYEVCSFQAWAWKIQEKCSPTEQDIMVANHYVYLITFKKLIFDSCVPNNDKTKINIIRGEKDDLSPSRVHFDHHDKKPKLPLV